MGFKKDVKNTGKDVGHAFKNFGKAMATTFKTTFGDEEKIDENGNSKVKESWKNVGRGFKKAGKDAGKTAKNVFSEEENKEEVNATSNENAVDVESVSKEEKEENK